MYDVLAVPETCQIFIWMKRATDGEAFSNTSKCIEFVFGPCQFPLRVLIYQVCPQGP